MHTKSLVSDMTQSAYSRLLPLRRSIAALLIIGAAAFTSSSTHGATYLWDSNPGTAGNQDGGGTWDTATNNWITGGSNVLWADTNDATFGGGVDGTYAVNVALNPTANSLIFNNSGYTLSAAAAQTITVSSATASIVLAAGKAATIGSNVTVTTPVVSANSAVSGAGNLIIESGGTLKNAGTASTNVLSINSTTVEVKTGGSLLTTAIAGGNGNAIFINGTVNVTGGNVSALGTLGIGQSTAAGTTAGTLTINNGTVSATSTNGIRFGATSGTTPGGTLNLNGGVLNAAILFKGATGVTSSIVNFNGGTLRPSATTATFMQGLTRANIRDGGAIIDTNGRDITIVQPLEHSNIGGDNAIDGGLTKSGTGTLALSGVNTYTGNTTLNGGALRLNNAAALGTSTLTSNNSGVQVQLSGGITITNPVRLFGAGANNDGTLKSLDGVNTVTNFGLSGAGGTRLNATAGSTLNLPNAITLGAGGAVQNLRLIGTGTFSFGGDNSAVVTAANSVFIGSGTSAGPTVQLGNDLAFGLGTIDFQPAANSTITSSDASARSIANPLKFSDTTLNQITFGAAATGNLTLSGAATLSGNVEASVQNTSTTLSGSISGIASLTKLGPGTLVLGGLNGNTFSEGAVIGSGVLDVQKSGGLGAGDVLVSSGATLKLELGTGNNYISDSGKLLLAVGSPVVELAFTGVPDTIFALSFDSGATFVQSGIWGSPTSGAQFTSSVFTGTGTVLVVPEPSAAALLLGCVTLLGLRRRRA
jgi:autotransporter-associated beta strand protein